MKILTTKTWKGIQRKLAENEKVIKWWQENNKKCEKAINELELKLIAKEKEYAELKDALQGAETKLKATTNDPINVAVSLGSNSASTYDGTIACASTKSSPSKKSSKK